MLITMLRKRMKDQKGFTLVELLVVILILGILAAIAIPSFINQTEKGNDAQAKAQVKTAQTAMETFGTENGGDYTGANQAALEGIEPTLSNVVVTVTGSGGAGVPSAADGYRLTVASDGGNTFSIDRQGTGDATPGEVSYPCTGSGGGCNGGTWPQ